MARVPEEKYMGKEAVMEITVELLMMKGGLSREDAEEVMELQLHLPKGPWWTRPEDRAEQEHFKALYSPITRETPAVCFVTREEFSSTPIEELDHRIQISVKAELTRQKRDSFWQVLQAKPLAEACNAAEISRAFKVLG